MIDTAISLTYQAVILAALLFALGWAVRALYRSGR